VLAQVFGGAQQTAHLGVGAGLHLVHIGLGDAVLFGFDQTSVHPFVDGEPLVVTTAHHGAQGLFGNQVGQDDVGCRVFGFLGAHRGQARCVGGVSLATASEVSAGGSFDFFKHHRLQVELVGAGVVGQILFGGGAGLHAHGGTFELLGAGDLAFGHHEALAVIVVGTDEVQAQGAVAVQGVGGVAGQHVDFARLQGGEALLCGQGHVFDFGRIAQHGSSHGTAMVHIQTRPVAAGVSSRETGQTGVDTADDLAALLDLVQSFARHGGCGRQQACRGQHGADQGLCHFLHGLNPLVKW